MTRTRIAEWSTEESLILLQGWRMSGLTIEEIAKNIGINKTTLYEWMKKDPNITNALKMGKEQADNIIENALFNKAKSGDTTAMIFWLKSRRPERWAEHTNIRMSGGLDTTIREDLKALSNEELKERLNELNKAGDKE